MASQSSSCRIKSEDEPQEKKRKVDNRKSKGQPSQNFESAAGIIASMRIQNFMCHENLAFDFNSNLNFVIGPNGSGKSAVLTALQVALGAGARSTERGSNVGDLVKKGCQTASVSVTLQNKGLFSFEPDLIGDKITIVRTLRTSGSGDYKIMNSQGKVIGNGKDWVERITNALNISINNPMCILTQNTAKTFLSSCKPKELYNFFTSATLLDDIKTFLEMALRERKSLQATVGRKEEMVELMKDEMQEKKKQYNAAKNLIENTNKLLELKKQLLWALVDDSVKDIERLDEEVKKKADAVDTEKAAIETIERVISNVHSEMIDVGKSITDTQEEMDRLQTELDQRGTEQNGATAKLREARNVHASVKKTLDRKHSEIKALETEIAKIRSTDFSDIAKQRQRKEEEIIELETAVEAYTQQKRTAENDMHQFRAAKEHAENEANQIKNQIAQCERDIRKKTSDIDRLSGGDRDPILAFGREHVSLARDLDARKMRDKIKGPVGAYVKVKDQSWAPAISCALGGEGNLCSYIVDSDGTANLLRTLMKKHQFRHIPSITATKFLGRQHDVENDRVQLDESMPMLALLDEIICDDPDVMNVLIDNHVIYGTLLIESADIAQQYMSDRNYVPEGCRVAYTKECDTFYPDPDYRTYPNRVSKQTYLQQTVEDIVEALRNEIVETEGLKRDFIANLRIHQADARANDEKYSEARNRVQMAEKQLKNAQMRAATLKKSLQNEMPTNMDLMTFEDELRNALEDLEEIKMEESGKDQIRAEAEQTLKEVKERIRALEAEVQTKNSLNQPFTEKLVKLQNGVRSHETKKLKHLAAITELSKEQKELETQKVTAKSSKIRREAEAMANCDDERVEPSAPSRKLTRTIQSLEAVIERERNRQKIEDIKVLMNEYNDFLKAFTHVKKDVDEMKSNLNVAMAEETYRRKAFSEFRDALASRVSHAVNATLSVRGFYGEPIIDFTKKEFHLKIAPKDRASLQSIATLSGGERSFSTLALVLAMWQIIDQPFRVMDEFDVYMDGINRQLSIDFIKLDVESRRDRQFILITPLGVDMEENEFLGIHKMHAPRPT